MNKSVNFKNIINYLFLFLSGFICYSQTDEAPSITASGRQVFCPGNSINIVTDFTITDPDDTSISEFFIQISSGYQIGLDRLELSRNYPSIATSWNQNEGKLTLSSANNTEILFTDLENAVKDVILTNPSLNVTEEKTFSFTIDDANYLPSTDHFYEFVSDERITWQQAKIAAENRTYFGRRGYLATLTSAEEADFAGKQASGAGWIGGSDEETEGEWKWVTGPEAGTVFWRGAVSGTTPNFAFWNNNEPNDFNGEDYAHITDPSIGIPGAWNDLPNIGGTGLYIPRGYIVEYGAPGDPPLNISASTSIYIPQIINTVNAEVCESGNATISATASVGEIFWYDSPIIGNQTEIARGSNLNVNVTQNTIYYASININGCNSLSRTPVTITVNERPTIINTTEDIICSGSALLSAESSSGDVYWYETATSTTPLFIGESFQTPNLTSTTSYFVEANVFNCSSSTRTEVIAIIDNTIPSFDVAQSSYALCIDIGNVDLETINAQDNYTYIWKKEGGLLPNNNSTINVTESGTYTVSAVSSAGCISPEQTIIVKDSEKSNLTKEDVIITDDSINNSIQIANLNIGSGDYVFSLDDINGVYSDNRFFDNLSPGIHTLYIKDKGGCGIQEYQFSILAYPKFFTPNGDGENDLWQINGFDKSFYTKSNIYIYNRFGNLLYTIEQNSQGWDGNFGGKKMPSNTYWFRVVLTDINGYSIEKFGNISLIR
jgi:gliding motility-associated-like protein